MNRITELTGVFAAVVALGALAGCVDGAPPPQHQAASAASAASGDAETPELAGAWYQIYFDTNSADINDRGTTIVRTVAYVVANIKDSAPPRVTVIGKTDRVGAPPANLALSKTRAETVRNALIVAGVPSDLIDTTWTGERRQDVATGDDVTERRNRVVDVTVIRQAR
jgi:OOP family OmpA-OmpF porin